ncbi:MAG: hypothetical protein F4X24_00110 [Rhodobacteraceae bacterium]|nr:hypothetical protein [Paracoccaceae bacterium]
MKDIPYQELMQNALFGVFREALDIVQMDGMPRVPGIVVDFDLTNPEVVISPRLQDLYQKEMTIVLEHWFEDLEVKEEGFWVTLNFNDIPERLFVPYLSIIYFFDQNANIGFQIPRYGQPSDVSPIVELSEEAPSQTTDKVVSLDDFRTK